MAASCSGLKVSILWSWALNIHGQLGQWCRLGCPFGPFCSWFASVDTFGMIQMSTAKCLNPECILGTIKYIFSMISEQWDGTDSWYIRPCLFCKVNIMAANNFWRGMFEIIRVIKIKFQAIRVAYRCPVYTHLYIYKLLRIMYIWNLKMYGQNTSFCQFTNIYSHIMLEKSKDRNSYEFDMVHNEISPVFIKICSHISILQFLPFLSQFCVLNIIYIFGLVKYKSRDLLHNHSLVAVWWTTCMWDNSTG